MKTELDLNVSKIQSAMEGYSCYNLQDAHHQINYSLTTLKFSVKIKASFGHDTVQLKRGDKVNCTKQAEHLYSYFQKRYTERTLCLTNQ